MRAKSCFYSLSPANCYHFCEFVTSKSATLPAFFCERDAFLHVTTTKNAIVCLCVCVRREEQEQPWKPKYEWQLGTQHALSIRLVCVVRRVHASIFLCVSAAAIEESWGEVWSCPSQHSQSWVTADFQQAPLSGTYKHTHTNQSMQPGAHYQTTNPRTAVNLQKTHGASLTELHLLIFRDVSDI